MSGGKIVVNNFEKVWYVFELRNSRHAGIGAKHTEEALTDMCQSIGQ